MPISLKYAVVERERRFLIAQVPEGLVGTREIVDRYVTGTRLRLREVREDDGTVTRKVGHKVRLFEGPSEIACANLYLDEAERATLAALPGRTLRKTRHLVRRHGWEIAVDEQRTAPSSQRSTTATIRHVRCPTGSKWSRTSAPMRRGPALASLRRADPDDDLVSSVEKCFGGRLCVGGQ